MHQNIASFSGASPVSAQRARLMLFSGGSACRNMNIALCRRFLDIARIVPAWDNGGSSRIIREVFDILPVGDIRHALMTMAYGEEQAHQGTEGARHAVDVVKICNARLSGILGKQEARAEFDYYADGHHPLLQRMEAGLRGAILNYLQLFKARMPEDFDLRNGSIGNFILTGAWLAHNNDINTAIFVFRKICSIEGSVWPASVENDAHLTALLNSGRTIRGQEMITSLNEEDSAGGIASIHLSTGKTNGKVKANEAMLEAIGLADAIVFGPGSFFTSILPHLMVEGVVEAISRNRRAAKFFIGNILECRETQGMDIAAMLRIFLACWKQKGGDPSAALTHVLVNRELFPFEKTVGNFHYLKAGAL